MNKPATRCVSALAVLAAELPLVHAQHPEFVPLGSLPVAFPGSASLGVSPDGAVVVGLSSSTPAGFSTEAFRWTAASGMTALGDLPGGAYTSVAHRASRGGAVVVGNSRGASGYEAFRWTHAGGMVGLGFLPGCGCESGATDVSYDGSVITGYRSERPTARPPCPTAADWPPSSRPAARTSSSWMTSCSPRAGSPKAGSATSWPAERRAR